MEAGEMAPGRGSLSSQLVALFGGDLGDGALLEEVHHRGEF